MADQPSWQDLLDLVEQLNNSGYETASVSYGDISVRLSQSTVFDTPPPTAPAASVTPAPAAVAEAAAPASPAAVETPTTSVSHAETIDAPMIGVFYRRPAPGAEPFVAPGDHVEADTTIGIIEIMKLMNPITAGKSGVIGEFLVEDGEAVEFGQPIATLS